MVRLIKVATKKHLLVKGCHGQINWLMYLQYYVYEISLKGGICHLFISPPPQHSGLRFSNFSLVMTGKCMI